MELVRARRNIVFVDEAIFTSGQLRPKIWYAPGMPLEIEKKRQRDKKRLQAEAASSDKRKKPAAKKAATTGSEHESGKPSDGKGPIALAKDAKDYLDAWKNSKATWKFQKVRQVWLLQNMYSLELVPEPVFTILVEYLTPLRGAGRDQTLKEAEAILKKSSEMDDGSDGEESEESMQHRRASQIVTALQQQAQ